MWHIYTMEYHAAIKNDFSGIGSRGKDLERQAVGCQEHADELGCRFLFDGGGGHERAGLMG